MSSSLFELISASSSSLERVIWPNYVNWFLARSRTPGHCIAQQVDIGGDPNTQYTIQEVGDPPAGSGPAQLPLPGFSIGGSQTWGQARYRAVVTGRNTAYNSTMTIEAGLGHGPIEMGTMSR